MMIYLTHKRKTLKGLIDENLDRNCTIFFSCEDDTRLVYQDSTASFGVMERVVANQMLHVACFIQAVGYRVIFLLKYFLNYVI
ncbi:hypothetical protein QVD17_39216 [Tagetes erecta]|uniref:Uncharacterized protein n=1 Tax=Tagetes erecta TaxID=13708 RepID=A0AAD8NGX8_TARER|nr:hypothetical protein QVD17_39216 [Tagetes erecta]